MDAGQGAEEAEQFRGRLKDCAAAALGDFGGEAGELEDVAEGLFEMKESSLAVQGLAAPFGLREVSRRADGFDASAPFIFAPPGV